MDQITFPSSVHSPEEGQGRRQRSELLNNTLFATYRHFLPTVLPIPRALGTVGGSEDPGEGFNAELTLIPCWACRYSAGQPWWLKVWITRRAGACRMQFPPKCNILRNVDWGVSAGQRAASSPLVPAQANSNDKVALLGGNMQTLRKKWLHWDEKG